MQALEGAASDFFEDDEEDFGLSGPGKQILTYPDYPAFICVGYQSQL